MDFQVVVLAGSDYPSLSPLTPSIPKMLLPIGNKPMIACVLDMLEGLSEHFQSPILIASPHDPVHSLAAYLDTYVPLQGLNAYSIIELPADCVSTIQILTYLVHQHIRSNLILISCDTLLDSEVLRRQLDRFRLSEADMSILLTTRASEDKLVYGLWEQQVLALGNEEDGVVLKKSLLKQYPRVNLICGLSDCYCYLFKNWLLTTLVESEDVRHLQGIKQELIPFLVKHQLDSKFLRTFQPTPPRLTIACFQVGEGYFAMRANNIKAYVDLNLKCCYPFGGKDKKGKAVKPQPVVLRSTRNNPQNLMDTYLKPQSQPPAFVKMISNDCIIGLNFSAGVGSSVTTSVIGRDVHLGGKVKISQSVIMDNVTVEDE